MKTLDSVVEGHKGICTPLWLNDNQVCNKIDGGVTGFFKLIKKHLGISLKTGDEFHGIIHEGIVKDSPTDTVRDLSSLDWLQRYNEVQNG